MRLPRRFFARSTLRVARELLGKFLIVNGRKLGGRYHLIGRIVETEAYIGVKDKACHASWRRRESCEVLWGMAGHAYVYFTYGIHWLLNVVTERKDFPAAVLIRAVEPVAGVKEMSKNRKLKVERGKWKVKKNSPSDLKLSTFNSQLSISNGPAKLTQALGINGFFNGEDLTTSRRLWIEDRGDKITKSKIQITKRVGVEYAKEYRDKPWRFYIKDNPFVSKV